MTIALGALAGILLAVMAMLAGNRLVGTHMDARVRACALVAGASLGSVAGASVISPWPALGWWLALSLPFAATALTDAMDHLVFPLALAPLLPLAPLLRADEGWTGPVRALAAGVVFFLAAEAVRAVAGFLAGDPEPAPLGTGDSLAVAAIGLTFGFGDGLRTLFAGMLLAAAVAAWMLLRRREPRQTMPYATCLCLAALGALAISPPA